MRPTLKFLFPALAASLTLAACGSGSKGSGSSSRASTAAASSSPAGSSTAASAGGSAAVVKRTLNATLGATVLTNARGLTLYRLGGEQNGKFICTSSSCLQIWHPLSASGAGAPIGSVGSLATVRRPDGTEQVTYRGMPLYTFAEDQRRGDVKGQGLKDVGTWNAVTTDAAATHPAPASQPAPAAPSTSGGRGGY
jgi:predicted lipoprotein with Yx(FWY)xxD motif